MSKLSLARLTGYLAILLVVFAFVRIVPAERGRPMIASRPSAGSVRTDQGRPPVIIIPGLIGSELINKTTGDKVWFNLGRAKNDDLRLPISADLAANRDDLVPGDILRKIQLIRFVPEIEVYQKLLEQLEKDGYTESKIDDPAETGFADTFYVFPYDWRRDNVENAHLLLEKMDGIRRKLKRPDLRFNIVAHSMGGLIARYAAMYGTADLTSAKMRPNWKSAAYFNSISLVGTPNGGSMQSLNSLLNGFSLFGLGKINLPFVRDLSKFDLFTIPAIFQLIPSDGTLRAFDENLRPLRINIYDPAVWEEYGWTAYTDRKFADEFDDAGQKTARAYFRAVLLRARLFQTALDADPGRRKVPVPIYYFGAECRSTLDAVVLYKDVPEKRWQTIFDADDFIKNVGKKFTKAELEKIFYSPGDGVVTKNSLIYSSVKDARLTIACGDHNRLMGQEEISRSLLGVLNLSGESPDNNAKSVKAKELN